MVEKVAIKRFWEARRDGAMVGNDTAGREMKPGRNQPCPCGSGRKYKRCCAKAPTATRSCEGCTACCDGWVRIEVDGVAVKPGHPCPHSTGSGCRIYERRPEDPCRLFHCAWVLGEAGLPDGFHPEKVGCLVLSDRLTWRGHPVDVAVPVGDRIHPEALAWLRENAEHLSRPLVYQEELDGPWQVHGPFEVQELIRQRLTNGLGLW